MNKPETQCGSLEPVGSALMFSPQELALVLDACATAAQDARWAIPTDRTKWTTFNSMRAEQAALLEAVCARIVNITPNTELSSGGPAGQRQQTEQAARRLLK